MLYQIFLFDPIHHFHQSDYSSRLVDSVSMEYTVARDITYRPDGLF